MNSRRRQTNNKFLLFCPFSFPASLIPFSIFIVSFHPVFFPISISFSSKFPHFFFLFFHFFSFSFSILLSSIPRFFPFFFLHFTCSFSFLFFLFLHSRQMSFLGSCSLASCTFAMSTGRVKKRLRFEKILLPEYQSNDIENGLVLYPICQIRFSNLPGFNWPFLPVEIGDFLQKAPSKNQQKRLKTPSKISLCSPS